MPSEWLALVGPLLATAGGGYGVIRLIEKLVSLWVARAQQRDDGDAAERESLRKAASADREGLREEIKELRARCDELERRLDEERTRHRSIESDYLEVRAENHVLRAHSHQLRNWSAGVMAMTQQYHRMLKLPDEDMPRVPSWVSEPIPGPTTRASEPPPQPETGP